MLWHNHCLSKGTVTQVSDVAQRSFFLKNQNHEGSVGGRELVNLTNAELRDITMHANILCCLYLNILYILVCKGTKA